MNIATRAKNTLVANLGTMGDGAPASRIGAAAVFVMRVRRA
jgi:hypothetical protein